MNNHIESVNPVEPPALAPDHPSVNLYHVAYSEETLAGRPDGFQVLDNLANQRPDWYELWPIRNFLMANVLDENAYYGFFSPKFQRKTELSADQVRGFLATDNFDSDAYLFCAQPDVGMFFRNIYVGGGLVYPGNLEATQAFVSAIGQPANLSTLVMDSSTTIFSNYVVARPAYWRIWLEISDQLFAIGEHTGNGVLTTVLNTPTTYRGGVQRKVFVAEGVASLICTTFGIKVKAYDPFAIPWFSVFRNYRPQAIAADALKTAYRATGRITYLQEFTRLTDEVFDQVNRRAAERRADRTEVTAEPI